MTTLEFSHVSRTYRVRGAGTLRALDNVSFALTSGRTMALVGQSGSGKSTIAKILTQLESPTSGSILLDGKPIPRRGRALSAPLPPAGADGLPGSVRLAQPVPHHPAPLGAPAAPRQGGPARRGRRRGAPPARAGEALAGYRRAQPARALRRTASARRDRACARVPTGSADRGRAGVDARRVDPAGVLQLLAELQRDRTWGCSTSRTTWPRRGTSRRDRGAPQGRVVERGASGDVILDPLHAYTRQLRDASPNPDAHFAAKAKPTRSPEAGS